MMRDFIVRVRNRASGQDQWITVSASSQGDARKRVSEKGGGLIALGIYDNIDDAQSSNPLLISQINASSFDSLDSLPGTASTFGSDPVGPDGVAENTFGPNAALVAPDDPTYQFQQFLSGLGRRGAGTSGVAGRARLDRYAPSQARFLADQALNPRRTGLAETFADFTAREPLSGQAANQSASDLFDQAVRAGSGLNPSGSTAEWEAFLPEKRGFLNPSDRDAAAQFENLARAKARSQFGVASEFFRPNVDLREQFFAQEAPTAMSFGDFLNKKIFGQAAPAAQGQPTDLGKIGTLVPGFSDDTRSQFDTYASGLGR